METLESLPKQPLDFLWLELTSRCNLACIHCYAESGMASASMDTLSENDYISILEDAARLGCRNVQFIGGEPTLNPALPRLIERARGLDYGFVEVFTNTTRLSESLLACFVKNDVAVATSFYADDPAIHDAITKRKGSHAATVRTLRRLVDAQLKVRAGMIVMPQNEARVDQTMEYLSSLGVVNCRTDRVRSVGRGTALLPDAACALGELCGHCWQGSVCVSPDGSVSPCIMSKRWSVGSLGESSFADIAEGEDLHTIRERVYREVWWPMQTAHNDELDCVPQCSPNCYPCYPHGRCDPELFCGPCGPGRRA